MNDILYLIENAEQSSEQQDRDAGKGARAELEQLRKIKQAAINLQSRLDDHFGGTYDWKEQAELRAALKGNK